jgi:hypothetical protein
MRRLYNIGDDTVHVAVLEANDGEFENRWIIRNRDSSDEATEAARQQVSHWLIDLFGDHVECSLQDEVKDEEITCDDVDFTEDEQFQWLLDTCGYYFHMVWDMTTV